MNKLSIYPEMVLLGTSTYTATPARMEPIQNGRRAIKNAEALRKAQVKQDRKAAKRFGK